MTLERFKKALTALMEKAPEDPLERDEFFEVTPLPAEDGPFEVVVVDEEAAIFAVLYLDQLFADEESEGQQEVEALVPAYLKSHFQLEEGEWASTAPFDLGWRQPGAGVDPALA